jgi:hypothetical protein
MRSHATRKLIGALLFGASALIFSAGTASAQLTITSEALAEPVQAAQAAAAANNWNDAIAAMRRAAQVPGITGAERAFIQQSILAYMVSGRQYQAALQQVQSMLQGNIGNRNQNLESALRLALNVGNQSLAEQYANDLGRPGDIAIFSAQAAYDRMDYDECIRLARPLAGGNAARGVLDLLSACYFAKDDFTGQRPILEQIAARFPSQEAWDALLRNVGRTVTGMSDEQRLQIQRLRQLTGNFMTPADYSGMAELAIITNFPGDALYALQLAEENEMSQGERGTRLLNTTNERVATNRAQLEAAIGRMQSDDTGFIAMKVAQAYNSYQEYAEAEAAARLAIQKGATGVNLQLALIELGRALVGQGDGQAAAAEFRKVEGYDQNDANAVIARLWSIYAAQA